MVSYLSVALAPGGIVATAMAHRGHWVYWPGTSIALRQWHYFQTSLGSLGPTKLQGRAKAPQKSGGREHGSPDLQEAAGLAPSCTSADHRQEPAASLE